jgi:hypothetical protein
MAFSDSVLQKVKRIVGGLCSEKTPDHLKEQLRFEYEIEKQNVIIFEVRPAWKNPSEFTRMPLAKLTYVKSENIWKLYWKRASGKWVLYEPKGSAKDLGVLVGEIDKDTHGCFFG